MPLPYTREALHVVAGNIHKVQEALQRPLVLENVSSYVEFAQADFTEAQFLVELTRRTGCELLLDVNNVYVSSVNHGESAQAFIDSIPAQAVRQIHLAGHSNNGDHLVDTHDQPVCEEVWNLYAYALKRWGFVPTMIERDDSIPPLAELLLELQHAKTIAQRVAQATIAGLSESRLKPPVAEQSCLTHVGFP